jgi:hypothetical protein
MLSRALTHKQSELDIWKTNRLYCILDFDEILLLFVLYKCVFSGFSFHEYICVCIWIHCRQKTVNGLIYIYINKTSLLNFYREENKSDRYDPISSMWTEPWSDQRLFSRSSLNIKCIYMSKSQSQSSTWIEKKKKLKKRKTTFVCVVLLLLLWLEGSVIRRDSITVLFVLFFLSCSSFSLSFFYFVASFCLWPFLYRFVILRIFARVFWLSFYSHLSITAQLFRKYHIVDYSFFFVLFLNNLQHFFFYFRCIFILIENNGFDFR